MSRTQRLLLWCAATDSTFELTTLSGARALVGKCIHCNRKLSILLDGSRRSGASVEHIVPKNHGGDDSLLNLAVACIRCNSEKGWRHDWKRRDDPKLLELVARLSERRKCRFREPPAGLALPPLGPT